MFEFFFVFLGSFPPSSAPFVVEIKGRPGVEKRLAASFPVLPLPPDSNMTFDSTSIVYLIIASSIGEMQLEPLNFVGYDPRAGLHQP